MCIKVYGHILCTFVSVCVRLCELKVRLGFESYLTL